MDAATFGQEAMRYERLLYHICWAMTGNDADCADIIQEALLRAWQHRDALRSMASFRPWLCRITANTCRDLLRKRKKLKMVPLTDTLMAPPYSDDPLALREALAKLSPEQRTAVVLHYYDGLTIQEISESLDIPTGTVKTRLMYARRNLSQLLREDSEVDA